MKGLDDRTVLGTVIAGVLGWALLLLALLALPLAVSTAEADEAGLGQSPDRNQGQAHTEAGAGTAVDIGQVATRTLPVWAQELLSEGPASASDEALVIIKSAATGSGDDSIVYNGSRITYTITISNPTSATAQNILVLDVLPEDALSEIACSPACERTYDTQYVPSPVGDTIEVTITRQVSWTIDSLAPGGTAAIEFCGKVAGQADGAELHNRAFVNYQLDGTPKSGLSNDAETIVRVDILEDGKASLSPAPTWLSSDFGGTLSMDWGDFDGDGDLDLALGSTLGTTVYRNNGGLLRQYWGNDRLTYGLRWADFDRHDGLELVAVGEDANHNPENYVYVHNAATRSFSESEFHSDDVLLRVAPGYFDGDEYLDLVVSTLAINTPCAVRWYSNTLEATQPFTGNGECVSDLATAALTPVDYDGDGNLDLALGLFPNATHVLLNQGSVSGTNPFSPATSIVVEEFAAYLPYDLAWGDYDQDGDLDLAAAHPLERGVRVYNYDQWTGEYVLDDRVLTNLFYTPLAVDWGDMDGDGRLDLVVADSPPRVFKYSSGEFVEILKLPTDAVQGQVWSIRAVDQDNEGDLDLTLSNRDGPSMLFPNFAPRLKRNLATIEVFGSPGASSVAWGDADGDGDLDLLFGASTSAVGSKLFLNEPGAYKPFVPENQSTFLASGFGPHDVAFGDVTGDLRQDVALALGTAAEVQVYYADNTQSPDWVSDPPYYADYSLAWGDADDDGDLDLLVGGDGPNRLYLNRGGFLSPTPAWASAEEDDTRDVAWGDYDGDRYLDFAAANYMGPNRIYRNNRNGSFSLAWNSPYISKTTSVAWANYDGDGDPDLAFGNDGEPNLIYANKDGLFGAVPIWRSTTHFKTTDLAWADWDNDGDLDLAVGNYDGPDQVYGNLNTRPGGPPQLYWIWGSQELLKTTGVAWGDQDGDGDLDLAISQEGKALNGVYENTYVMPSHLTENFASTMPLPNNPSYVWVKRPVHTDGAYLYSSSELLSGPKHPTVTIQYRLFDPDGTREEGVSKDVPGDPIHLTTFEFSLDGGATWKAATRLGASTPPTGTSRLGQPAEFLWDAVADQAISDNARFRIRIVPESTVGPVKRALTSAISPPFRVRGTTCVWPESPSILIGTPEPTVGEEIPFEGVVAQASGVMTFTWKFDDGSTDQGQVVYHTFWTHMPHVVTMTVRSEACPIAKEVVVARQFVVGLGEPTVYLPYIAREAEIGDASSAGSSLATGAGLAGGVLGTGVGETGGRDDPVPGSYGSQPSTVTGEASALGEEAGLAVERRPQAAINAALGVINVTDNTDGVNNQPSVNADGTRIAFWSTSYFGAGPGNADGNIELFVARVDPEDQNDPVKGIDQVTNSMGNILGGFSLSPRFPITGTSSSYFAFFSDRDLTFQGTNDDANFEIFVAKMEKGQATIEQLTFTEQGGNILPSLNADATRIAFASDRDLDPDVDNSDSNMEIFVLDMDLVGRVYTPTQVTDTPPGVINDAPAINAAGTRIAYISNGDLMLAEVAHDGHVRLTTLKDGGDNLQPAISAQGDRFAFVSGDDIYWAELTVTGVVSENITARLPGRDLNDEPAISADGTRIAFVSDGEIFFFDTEADSLSKLPQVTKALHPSLSADGTRVAFVSEREIRLATAPRTDLYLIKSSEPATVVPGLPITYTLRVGNNGPGSVFSATVTDDLPIDVINAVWTCTASSSKSTCHGDSGDFLSDTVDIWVKDVLTYVISGMVDSAALGQLVNTAEVAMPEGAVDWQPDSNRKTLSDPLVPQANLGVDKQGEPDELLAGRTLTYTLVYSNPGPSDARQVYITDTLPTEMTFGGMLPPLPGLAGPTVTLPYVTWYTDALPADGSGTIVFTVTTKSNVLSDTVVTNRVEITSSTAESEPGDNVATVPTTLTTEADLAVVKWSDPPSSVVAGETLTYTLVYTNEGPSTAWQADLTDTLPTGFDFGGVVSADAGTPDPQVNPPYVVWHFPTLTSGPARTIEFTVTVRPEVSGRQRNDVEIASRTHDPVAGNNSDTDWTSVNVVSDLGVVKWHHPQPAVSGGTVTYTLVYSNAGPSTARNVFITDTLPPDMSWTTWAEEAPPLTGPVPQGQKLTWDLNDLAPGPGGRITFTVSVGAWVSQALTNSVEITGTDDANTTNNIYRDGATIGADLAIAKTASPERPRPGRDTLTYVVTVTNLGPSNVVSATVFDDIPDTAFPKNGVTWTCQPSPGASCSAGADGDLLDEATLPVMGTVVYTITGDLESGADDILTNTAVVTPPVWITDTNLGNNRAVFTTTTSPAADLQVSKTVNKDRAAVGDEIVYTVVVFNDGPSNAKNVEFTDLVPISITIDEVDPGGGTYNQANGQWKLSGWFEASEVQTLTIRGTLQPAALGEVITNTAYGLTASKPVDLFLGNNQDSAAFVVSPKADLGIIKWVTGPDGVRGPSTAAAAGDTVTYTIEFSNTGPQTATHVVITDPLPPALTFPVVVSSGVIVTDTGIRPGYVWQVQDLAQDEGGVITITGILASGLPKRPIPNRATIDTMSVDPDPGNNRGEATVEIADRANLVITKTVIGPAGGPSQSEVAAPGERITYTIAFVNTGPHTATQVIITDIVPVSVTNVMTDHRGAVIDPQGTTEYVWWVEPLVKDAGGVITITGVLSDSLPDSSFLNTAEITADVIGDDPADSQSTAEVVVRRPELTITKTVTPTTKVDYHGTVTYTVVLANSGQGDARSTRLTDTLPGEVDFGAWVLQPPGATESGDEVTWSGTVTAGEQVTFTFLSDHVGDYGDVVTNVARYGYHSSQGTAEATFTVRPFGVTIEGSSTGAVTVTHTFTATVSPAATYPLTYTWQATDKTGVEQHTVSSLNDTVVYSWTVAGPKTVTVTVDNIQDTVITNHTITIQP